MKALITGGAGFIGTELAKLLKNQGHEVSIFDLKNSPQEDVRDRNAVLNAAQGADIIFHLAAEHRDDVRPAQLYYDVNTGGAENIIAAAEEHGVKTIIFTSSVAVYGLDAGEAREDQIPTPFNDYGRSKLQAEKILESWTRKSPDRTLVTVRLVATFGPGNRGNIHTLMNQIRQRKFIMVGGGKNKKSIAYVENAAEFLAQSLNLKSGIHLYNYADKPDLTTAELVKTITRHFGFPKPKHIPYFLGLTGGLIFDILAFLTGKKFPISLIRVRKFCANTIVNADKVKTTGFKPKFTLKQGLENMLKEDFHERKR